ncbi:MAG: hypothetical protein ABH842_03890 [Candidatus Micrarchaeota archaeon]
MEKYIEKILFENIVKNIFLIIFLVLLFGPINDYLIYNTQLSTDAPLAGDTLVAISILAVVACFGNFAFTYEKIHFKSFFERMLGHAITGIVMLIIGISLIFTSTLLYFLIGDFIVVNFLLLLLYVSMVIYDFWDLLKAIRLVREDKRS